MLASTAPRSSRPARRKVLVIGALAVCAAVVLLAVPPFTRPASYYAFADRREILGIPNFMDVVSNLPWLLVGALGLRFIARRRGGSAESPFADEWERAAFATLFAGIVLVACGSVYFHLAPTPAALLWDRLPMSLAFMALFTIVIGERIDRRAGRALLIPLVALGIASVVHWRYTELLGRGDERLYALVQFFPMLAIPVILLLSRAPFCRTGDLAAALAWYGLAKLLEYVDGPVLVLTGGTVSGHTLKHLAAVVATVWLLRMMRLRRPLRPASALAS